MDTVSWLGLGLSLLCLALLVLFWMAEVSIASASRGRIKRQAENGEKKAQVMDKLLGESTSLFSTLIVALSIVFVGFIVSASVFVVTVYGSNWVVALIAAIVGFFIIALLRGISRQIALKNPERLIVGLAGVLSFTSTAFAPLSGLVSIMAGAISRLVRTVDKETDEEEVDEMRLLVDVNHEEVNLEEGEKEMIRAVVGLDETMTREIMVPRIDIVAANKGSSIAEIIDLIVTHGYTRVPIYEDTIDNIVGVVYAKDLLPILAKGEGAKPITEIARVPHFVPESKKVDELLHEFQQSKVHMAIVVDEYGGTAGLVTIEDLLEEIVGEIEDEYDAEEPKVERISSTEAIMNAKVSIDDFKDIFGIDIEGEDFDTVGGFVFSQLGRIPNIGDIIDVDGIKIEILSTVGQRVKEVKVTKVVINQSEETE
ncbi:MAG: HlyC/CorC family transporter [Anaerolineales bacterium]|nr:HlyC/CorC family transporter [Anaerolineales bacterium]